MTTGIALQAQAPGAAGAELGFWLGSQISGQPMAMTEDRLAQLMEAISANRFTLPRNRKTGARITEKGTAIVELHGILIDRAPILGTFWGLTAYEGFAEQCARLETHADVKRVVLDVDSPGGLVRGIEGAAKALERLASKKPVYAIAHNQMCSAAYWLGSIAESISVAPGAEVGSIGVRGGHVSYAEQLERAGIRVTIFSAGTTKTDGSPYSLLSDGEYAEKTYEMERINDSFVAHVARHRPMTEQAVRDLAARCFSGPDAVKAKLADRVESLDDMIARLERRATTQPRKKRPAVEPGSKAGLAPLERTPANVPDDDEPAAGTLKPKGAKLMDEQNAPAEASDLAALITEAITGVRSNKATAPAAAPAPAPAPAASAQPAPAPAADAVAAAVDAALSRVFAILESDEGKARPKMALALAKAGIGADAAKGILAAAPEEAAAKPAATGDGLADALSKEMAKPGNAAGVKPEASGQARPSLAEKMKARAKR